MEDFLEPNEETRQAIEDVMAGQNLLGLFETVEEMMTALLWDDELPQTGAHADLLNL